MRDLKMSIASKKAGVVLAAATGAAFLAMSGCATQQSGAATPENLPSNCKVITKAACKGMASCKGVASCKAKSGCGNKCSGSAH
jgi:hypothetical protein